MSKKVTVEMTWERLAAMDDNGNRLWATPGASAPYWNWEPSYTYDECVGAVHKFVDQYGMQYDREDTWDDDSEPDDRVFILEIKIPDSQPYMFQR